MIDLKRDEQCPHCGRFSNRGLSIDAVIIKDNEILLVQRGAEFDTGLNVINTKFVGVYSSPDRHPKQVINIVYLAEVEEGEPKAGDDAQDVRWFPLDALPEKMAFDHKQNITDALKILCRQR